MLVIKNLYKQFGDIKVLKNINLEIKKGERVVIIGPSGSGKSTLLRTINYLNPPTRGEIYFEDKLINSANINEIRSKIGMVFQQFNLFNNLKVIDNIALAPIKINHISKKEAYLKAQRLLKRFNLNNRKDSYPSSLSGGMKQRVAIIRTLAMNPEIMLFDEPTSALDPEMVNEVVELILEVAKTDMTMIIVSHEIEFVKKIATRVIFLEDGKIILDGTPKEIFNNGNERIKEFIK